MAKRLVIPAVCVLILGAVSFLGADAEEATPKVEKSMCLACHGSFDDIAAATAGYKAPSGETGTPHRCVPHKEKTDIPECVECHKPHPIPPESEVEKPKDIEWCYTGCHHAKNLQACSTCH